MRKVCFPQDHRPHQNHTKQTLQGPKLRLPGRNATKNLVLATKISQLVEQEFVIWQLKIFVKLPVGASIKKLISDPALRESRCIGVYQYSSVSNNFIPFGSRSVAYN